LKTLISFVLTLKILLFCRQTLKQSCRARKTIHFCFWDHLHLSTGLKVIDALQWSPYFSLKLRFSPLRLPPSLPPLLLLCCTPPPAPGPERRPAALRPSAPRSTRRAALPPTARSARAGRPLAPPRRAEAPSGRHAALISPLAPPAALRLAVCSPSPLSFFPTMERGYKTGSSPCLHGCFAFAFFHLAPPNRRRRFLTGILLSRTILTHFLEP
jgi:hypothetical protein